MGGVVTKEQAISHEEYLELVYSQSGMLYDLIPNTPRVSTNLDATTSNQHPMSSQFHTVEKIIGST